MNAQTWAGLVGFFMPFVVEVFKSKTPKKRWVAYSISLGVSVVVGLLSTYFNGKFDFNNILGSASTALLTAQTTYNFWFRNSKVAKRIEKELK